MLDHMADRRRPSPALLFTVAIACILASCVQAAAPADTARRRPVRHPGPMVPPHVAASLQSALNDWAASENHRGVSAAVILGNGAEWVSTAGIEGTSAPLLPEHLVVIASITKTMTGAVILQLAEEGILDLDDPVSSWLDARPNVDPTITIRQLLNHTNGLANYTLNPELLDAINADPSHVFTSDELLSYVGERSFAPGERTEYTNTSFVLLGLIAEHATGRTITTLYRERIWQPSGLTEIFIPGLEEPAGPVARAWSGRPPSQQEVNPLERMSLLTVGNSAFGLYSNARTVARWGRALFAGDILGEAMRAEMLEFVPAAGNIPGESGAGLGIRRYSYLGREQWGHSGGASLGSSLLLFDPTTKTTVVVIMNQGSSADHFVLAPKLLELATER